MLGAIVVIDSEKRLKKMRTTNLSELKEILSSHGNDISENKQVLKRLEAKVDNLNTNVSNLQPRPYLPPIRKPTQGTDYTRNFNIAAYLQSEIAEKNESSMGLKYLEFEADVTHDTLNGDAMKCLEGLFDTYLPDVYGHCTWKEACKREKVLCERVIREASSMPEMAVFAQGAYWWPIRELAKQKFKSRLRANRTRQSSTGRATAVRELVPENETNTVAQHPRDGGDIEDMNGVSCRAQTDNGDIIPQIQIDADIERVDHDDLQGSDHLIPTRAAGSLQNTGSRLLTSREIEGNHAQMQESALIAAKTCIETSQQSLGTRLRGLDEISREAHRNIASSLKATEKDFQRRELVSFDGQAIFPYESSSSSDEPILQMRKRQKIPAEETNCQSMDRTIQTHNLGNLDLQSAEKASSPRIRRGAHGGRRGRPARRGTGRRAGRRAGRR